MNVALRVNDDGGRTGLISKQVGGVGQASQVVLLQNHLRYLSLAPECRRGRIGRLCPVGSTPRRCALRFANAARGRRSGDRGGGAGGSGEPESRGESRWRAYSDRRAEGRVRPS